MTLPGSSDRPEHAAPHAVKWKIIVLCVAVACFYGVSHDQVTIRICPEYFTLAHPPFFPTSNLTVLAFCWGIAATWWIGAAFGFVLALILRQGRAERGSTQRLATRLTLLLAITAASAILAGAAGYQISRSSVIALPAALADAGPLFDRDRFVAVWFAHIASYAVGGGGGVLLLLHIWRERGHPAVLALFPRDKFGAARVVVLSACVLGLIYWRVCGS